MDPPSFADVTLILQLVLFVLLLGCSAFFSGSEVALFSLNQIQLDQMVKENHPRLALIRHLLKDPRVLISTILIGNELVNVAASNISATLLIQFFGSEEKWWVNILVMLPILLLFGEITPKTIAVRNSIVVAGLVSRPLALFGKGITPLRQVVGWVSNIFITLVIGKQTEKQTTITEAMVRTLTEQASQDGAIDDVEHTYINNIFNFDTIRVKDIMTPRARIFFLPKSADINEIIMTCKQTGYTRIPIFEGHRDDVQGILHVRDLIKKFPEHGKLTTEPMTLLRKPYFVSANRLVSSLFQSFKEKNQSLAMVVDEYGGLVGMVTMHDLLETIFGPMNTDQQENPQEDSNNLTSDQIQLEGVLSVDEFTRMTGYQFQESIEAETMGGVVLESIGELPEVGQKVIISNWEFTVLKVESNRITTLLACRCDRLIENKNQPVDALSHDTNQTESIALTKEP